MARDIFGDVADERIALVAHPIFSNVKSMADVRTLMEFHIYAVWDFMSLLKRLQIDLTCIHLPWLPSAHTRAARLINEIIVGEETDEMPGGGFISHLELYLLAMEEVGAQTATFRAFLRAVAAGTEVEVALRQYDVPEIAASFVLETLHVAQFGTTEEVLAYFFFGREDIIPDMFTQLLETWSVPETAVPMFTYYLKRHIELDGDDHGPAAKQIISGLIHNAEQEERLLDASRRAVAARMRLWDGVNSALLSRDRHFAAIEDEPLAAPY